MAMARCHWQPFALGGAPTLVVERVKQLLPSTRQPLEGSLAPWGYYQVDGDFVRAQIPDDVYAAEAVLRIAVHLCCTRAGGILVHGAGIAFGDVGVAAVGPSGAGKSTLSALCVGRGARLLSDEITQLFPCGTAHGTPFRSNAENVGSPGGVKLRSLLLMEKGDHEQMDAVEPARALPELLSQVYRPIPGGIGPGEVFRRLSAILAVVPVHRLTFRKDPSVGDFLQDWLAGERD
ncbi:MAG: hypothetical protein ACYC8T_31860 [Myxococcaceae bacterium]